VATRSRRATVTAIVTCVHRDVADVVARRPVGTAPMTRFRTRIVDGKVVADAFVRAEPTHGTPGAPTATQAALGKASVRPFGVHAGHVGSRIVAVGARRVGRTQMRVPG